MTRASPKPTASGRRVASGGRSDGPEAFTRTVLPVGSPTGKSSDDALGEAVAALVDGRDGDRLTERAGVHHHAVADVEADVADRRVEEDELAGQEVRTRHLDAEGAL